MENIMRDATSVVLAIVGVALLYTLVAPRNETANVIRAATSGVGSMLTAAMGGGASRSTVTGQ